MRECESVSSKCTHRNFQFKEIHIYTFKFQFGAKLLHIEITATFIMLRHIQRCREGFVNARKTTFLHSVDALQHIPEPPQPLWIIRNIETLVDDWLEYIAK